MTTELSKRQLQVLKLYLAGYTPQEIGRILNLHPNSIHSYKRIIMDKWEVENMVELIIEAVRRGYIDFETEEEKEPVEIVYTDHTLTHDTYVYFKEQRKKYIYTCEIKYP